MESPSRPLSLYMIGNALMLEGIEQLRLSRAHPNEGLSRAGCRRGIIRLLLFGVRLVRHNYFLHERMPNDILIGEMNKSDFLYVLQYARRLD